MAETIQYRSNSLRSVWNGKKLENIDEPENTVILLNAFDEDIETIRNHVS
jgi:hypothetical protein